MVEVPDIHGDSVGIPTASYGNSDPTVGDSSDSTDNNVTVPVVKVMLVNGEVVFKCKMDRQIPRKAK